MVIAFWRRILVCWSNLHYTIRYAYAYFYFVHFVMLAEICCKWINEHNFSIFFVVVRTCQRQPEITLHLRNYKLYFVKFTVSFQLRKTKRCRGKYFAKKKKLWSINLFYLGMRFLLVFHFICWWHVFMNELMELKDVWVRIGNV